MNTHDAASDGEAHGWISRVVAGFLRGNLSILLIIMSLLLGGAALLLTPREEDPQIIVPVADVIVTMPGASAREVERQVATRLEKLLYQIDGVEHVYSTSYPSQAVITVRFYVGQDRERSYVKLHNKINANIDQVPPGVTGWVVRPVEIDDAPIVNLTLYSTRYSDYELRRCAEELEIRLQAVTDAGRTYVVGGRPREVAVQLHPERLASRGVSVEDVQRALTAASAVVPAGTLVDHDRETRLQAGRFLASAREVADLVVSVHEQRPVYLREVADVHDGPAEATSYTELVFGPQAGTAIDPVNAAGQGTLPAGITRGTAYPAVTVAVAKRKGTNAVSVARAVQAAATTFSQDHLPAGMHLRVTRDSGYNANDKVNGLVESLLVAIIIVVALLAYTLGWREGLIIALAVPITFSFTLLVNYLLGYSINRVTLFALILALGLVVDDPIVDVENIHRHFAQRLRKPREAVLAAVNEVRPPIILATLAVILSFIPMFFITGMMGPYMAPMALNVPVAMLMSLVVAFTVTPWLGYHLLKYQYYQPHPPFVLERTLLYRGYQALMRPLFAQRRWQVVVLLAVLLLLAGAGLLALTRRVPLKMLPFDNKNELQLVLDQDEGTTLEATAATAHDLVAYLQRLPEVTDITTYVGISSPADFNGLIRHYYLRQGSHLADIRFNLVEKHSRAQQSHAIALRIRRDVAAIAARHQARLKIVEVPPGPPVIATLVAEVSASRGQDYAAVAAAAEHVRDHFAALERVVDVDTTLIAPQPQQTFQLDRAKAALHGITEQQVATTLGVLVGGDATHALRLPDQVNPVRIRLQLPRAERDHVARLGQLQLSGANGERISLSELGTFVDEVVDQPIYHKNLVPVVYVMADTAGLPPPEAVLALWPVVKRDPALAGFAVEWVGEGEWEVTVRAFRDLGIAFGVAVLFIYLLLLYQTGSYLLPAIQLVALPLSVIGIMPGFWVLNLLSKPVDGWPNPVYFTATAMIGMIALSGIATRNAILLIEFVEARKREGRPLIEALVAAGALRARPIFLTSLAAMLAAWPITLDPIFSGLSWALIFGLLVSTLFTLVVVPLIYYLAYRRTWGKPAVEAE